MIRAALALLVATAPSPAQDATPTPPGVDDADFRVYWNDGVRLRAKTPDIALRLGVRVENDWAFFVPQDSVKLVYGPENGTEFRRVRFSVSGQFEERLRFRAQYDFADGNAEPKSLYLQLNEIPIVGQLRAGNFKEPFGLERVTPSRYLTFMERGLTGALIPSRNTGAMVFDRVGKRLLWAVGAYRTSDSFGKSEGDDGYSVTARIAGQPLYERKEERLLHIGAAISQRWFTENEVRFRARPESHLAPRLVDTGRFAAERGTFVGLEAAIVLGPLSLQAEHVRGFLDTPSGGDLVFHATYGFVSWFPTGERRRYRRAIAAFHRLRPESDFLKGGTGALEAVARLSHVDLDDRGIPGGRLTNATLGLNWYLNDYTRVMCNVVLADRSSIGSMTILQMRLQLDF